MEVTKTKMSQIRDKRNQIMIGLYKERFTPGSQITPVIEGIAEECNVKYSTAYKVIKVYRESQLPLS